MPQYLPFAGRNAIAEMSIGIQLVAPFDQRIGEALSSIRNAFTKDEFPKLDPVQVFSLSIANVGSPLLPVGGGPPGVTGFSLTKSREDGSVSRAVRAINNMLSIHFVDYTSWAEIKPQAMGYIRRCLDTLGVFDRNQVTGIILRYIDQFTFDGTPDEANAGLLFRRDSRFVTLRVLDRGYQWQSNSGWFEPLQGPISTLNQLNMSSGQFQTAAVGIVVDHNSICNLPTPYKSMVELMNGQGNQPSLETILNLQHRANADLMKNLLNDKMLETIGLKG